MRNSKKMDSVCSQAKICKNSFVLWKIISWNQLKATLNHENNKTLTNYNNEFWLPKNYQLQVTWLRTLNSMKLFRFSYTYRHRDKKEDKLDKLTVVIVSAAAIISAKPWFTIWDSRSCNMGCIPSGTLSIRLNISLSSERIKTREVHCLFRVSHH